MNVKCNCVLEVSPANGEKGFFSFDEVKEFPAATRHILLMFTKTEKSYANMPAGEWKRRWEIAHAAEWGRFQTTCNGPLGFLFTSFVPLPNLLVETAEEYWGARRNPMFTKEEFRGTRGRITFCTDSAPPAPFLWRLSAAFPMLNFRLTYRIEGSAIGGFMEYCAGFLERSEEHGFRFKEGILSAPVTVFVQ